MPAPPLAVSSPKPPPLYPIIAGQRVVARDAKRQVTTDETKGTRRL